MFNLLGAEWCLITEHEEQRWNKREAARHQGAWSVSSGLGRLRYLLSVQVEYQIDSWLFKSGAWGVTGKIRARDDACIVSEKMSETW